MEDYEYGRVVEGEVLAQAAMYRDVEEEMFVQAAMSGDSRPQSFHKSERFYAALQAAAGNGHANLVKQLLGNKFPAYFFQHKGMPANEEGWYFWGDHAISSPLHLAVKEGHVKVVQEIIDWFERTQILSHEGEVPDMRKRKEFTAKQWFQRLLEWAVRWGHASIVQLLLTRPLLPIQEKLHPLHLAAHLGNFDVLKLLLQHPHRPYEEEANRCLSKDGLTALHLAAQSGCLSVVELLIDTAKMDVSARSSPDLFTPLHMAANSGHTPVVSFLVLHMQHSDLEARDCMGRTALHYAAREGHDCVAQQLLSMHGGDIALIADHDGLLPLHMAAKRGHVKLIKSLMGHGGINYMTKQPLHMRRCFAREHIRGGMIKSCNLYFGKTWRFPRPMLIDSVFWKTEGFTPLHFAARYGHDAAVEELVKKRNTDKKPGERDADLLLKDSGGFLAYDWMQVHNQGEAFLNYVMEGGVHEGQLVDSLKRSSSVVSKLTNSTRILEIASDIKEEKQALEELLHIWERGNSRPIRTLILQWFIQDIHEDFSELSTWQTRINLDAFSCFAESLDKGDFAVSKGILFTWPEITADVRLSKKVKEVLMSINWVPAESKDFLDSFLVELVRSQDNLVGASNLLRWLLPWVKEKHLNGALEAILDQPELKRGLYEDRQVYLDSANAILVGAALIAGVAFQGWLQPPLGYGFLYKGESYANVEQAGVHTFWWFNNGAFFLAVGSLIAGAEGAAPVADETDIVEAVAKVRKGVAVASLLLCMALVCVVGAFTAAGFAVLPPLTPYRNIMPIAVACGATICGLALLCFVLSMQPLVLETLLKPGIGYPARMVYCFCTLFVGLWNCNRLNTHTVKAVSRC